MAEDSLIIRHWQNDTHEFAIEGQKIQIRQFMEEINESIQALHLKFELSAPSRFSIQLLIPEESVNACIILNNQLLISPFGGEWPEQAPDLNLSECQKKGDALSTLRPGEFQKINFRWQNNDHLVCYRIIQ